MLSVLGVTCGGARAFIGEGVGHPGGANLNFMFLDCALRRRRGAACPLTLANACCPAGSDSFSAISAEARVTTRVRGAHNCCSAELDLLPAPTHSSHRHTSGAPSSQEGLGSLRLSIHRSGELLLGGDHSPRSSPKRYCLGSVGTVPSLRFRLRDFPWARTSCPRLLGRFLNYHRHCCCYST